MNDLEAGIILLNEQKLSWGYVLSKSYKLYTEYFWIYFRIAIIPAVVAYAFTYFERPASLHFLRSGFLPRFSPGWVAVTITYYVSTGCCLLDSQYIFLCRNRGHFSQFKIS